MPRARGRRGEPGRRRRREQACFSEVCCWHAARFLAPGMQHDRTFEHAPDVLDAIDDEAIAEQLARIAELFGMEYDELVEAFRNNR